MARKVIYWACLFAVALLVAVWLKHTVPDYVHQQSVAACDRYVHAHVNNSIPDNTWGRWSCDDLGTTYPVASREFSTGQTIIIPNYRSFRVDSVERNWRPTDEFDPEGDDISGKEIILVHLSVTNISNTDSDGFNPVTFLTLIRANGHEQRCALLAFDLRCHRASTVVLPEKEA